MPLRVKAIGSPITFGTRDERPHPFDKLRAGFAQAMLGWGALAVIIRGAGPPRITLP